MAPVLRSVRALVGLQPVNGIGVVDAREPPDCSASTGNGEAEGLVHNTVVCALGLGEFFAGRCDDFWPLPALAEAAPGADRPRHGQGWGAAGVGAGAGPLLAAADAGMACLPGLLRQGRPAIGVRARAGHPARTQGRCLTEVVLLDERAWGGRQRPSGKARMLRAIEPRITTPPLAGVRPAGRPCRRARNPKNSAAAPGAIRTSRAGQPAHSAAEAGTVLALASRSPGPPAARRRRAWQTVRLPAAAPATPTHGGRLGGHPPACGPGAERFAYGSH